ECSSCSLALRYRRERWPRWPLASSRATGRFFWAFTERLPRAMVLSPCDKADGGGVGLAAQQVLDPLLVARGCLGAAVLAALELGALVLHQVVLAGLAAHQLARTADLEPLLGATVGLHLRHRASPHRSVAALGSGRGAPAAARCVDGDYSAAASSASRSRPFLRPPPLTSPLGRCGATTMTMLRPSCLGADSTAPRSAISSASLSSRRRPS